MKASPFGASHYFPLFSHSIKSRIRPVCQSSKIPSLMTELVLVCCSRVLVENQLKEFTFIGKTGISKTFQSCNFHANQFFLYIWKYLRAKYWGQYVFYVFERNLLYLPRLRLFDQTVLKTHSFQI